MEAKILKEIEGIIKQRRAKNVLLYCPLKSEVDVFPLLWILKRNPKIKLFVPFVEGERMSAILFRLPLHKGRFGILQPSKSNFCTQKLDLMVVPSIAWDKNLGRIGFGKGFYDRFYAKLSSKPYIIFVSYLSFFVKEKVTQNFDICGDIALSPKCNLRRKKSGNIVVDRPYNNYCFRA